MPKRRLIKIVATGMLSPLLAATPSQLRPPQLQRPKHSQIAETPPSRRSFKRSLMSAASANLVPSKIAAHAYPVPPIPRPPLVNVLAAVRSTMHFGLSRLRIQSCLVILLFTACIRVSLSADTASSRLQGAVRRSANERRANFARISQNSRGQELLKLWRGLTGAVVLHALGSPDSTSGRDVWYYSDLPMPGQTVIIVMREDAVQSCSVARVLSPDSVPAYTQSERQESFRSITGGDFDAAKLTQLWVGQDPRSILEHLGMPADAPMQFETSPGTWAFATGPWEYPDLPEEGSTTTIRIRDRTIHSVSITRAAGIPAPHTISPSTPAVAPWRTQTAVPSAQEPSSAAPLLLFGIGIAGFMGFLWWRTKRLASPSLIAHHQATAPSPVSYSSQRDAPVPPAPGRSPAAPQAPQFSPSEPSPIASKSDAPFFDPSAYAQWNEADASTPPEATRAVVDENASWPELRPLNVTRGRLSESNPKYHWESTLSLGEVALSMPAIATYVHRRFQDIQLPAEIGWDPDMPRDAEQCGIILLQHLKWDVYLRLRLAFHRRGRVTDVTAIGDLIMIRDASRLARRALLITPVTLLFALFTIPLAQSLKFGLQFSFAAALAITGGALCIAIALLTFGVSAAARGTSRTFKTVWPVYVLAAMGTAFMLGMPPSTFQALSVLAGIGVVAAELATRVDFPEKYEACDQQILSFRKAFIHLLPIGPESRN